MIWGVFPLFLETPICFLINFSLHSCTKQQASRGIANQVDTRLNPGNQYALKRISKFLIPKAEARMWIHWSDQGGGWHPLQLADDVAIFAEKFRQTVARRDAKNPGRLRTAESSDFRKWQKSCKRPVQSQQQRKRRTKVVRQMLPL